LDRINLQLTEKRKLH